MRGRLGLGTIGPLLTGKRAPGPARAQSRGRRGGLECQLNTLGGAARGKRVKTQHGGMETEGRDTGRNTQMYARTNTHTHIHWSEERGKGGEQACTPCARCRACRHPCWTRRVQDPGHSRMSPGVGSPHPHRAPAPRRRHSQRAARRRAGMSMEVVWAAGKIECAKGRGERRTVRTGQGEHRDRGV